MEIDRREQHETLPASIYVAAGDGVRGVKAPQFINFYYFNAAGVVVEWSGSLGDKRRKMEICNWLVFTACVFLI